MIVEQTNFTATSPAAHSSDDRELLRHYVEHQSEMAFAELAHRHVGLAFGTALRLVGDRQLAQDVAQKVFIQLARKAWTIREGNALPGWIYRVTCGLAVSALRSEMRRREWEGAAMKESENNERSTVDWSSLAPLLDEAMRALKPAEQDAVVLRFFEGKSLREVGAALALSDDGAQKRVSRALEKLRGYFSRRGVVTTAAVLASTLGAHATTIAPSGLAHSVSGVALAAVGKVGWVGWLVRLCWTTPARWVAGVTAIFLFGIGGLWAAGWWQHQALPQVQSHLLTLVVKGAFVAGVPINQTWTGPGPDFNITAQIPNSLHKVTVSGTILPKRGGYQVAYNFEWMFPSTTQQSATQAGVTYQRLGTSSTALLQVDEPIIVWDSGGNKLTLTLSHPPAQKLQ